MVKGLVSVIIPTYNRGSLAVKAVESVLAQTHAQVEALVVDDGSKDDTRELIQRNFASNDRVRYFLKQNGGVASARNEGLRQARGEFIAFLDSDDTWYTNKIALQLECLARFPGAGMVWSDLCAVNEQGVLLRERFLRVMYSTYKYFPTPGDLFAKGQRATIDGVSAYAGDILSPMVLGSLVHTSTVLLTKERADRVGFFDESKRLGEDYPYHLKTCAEGPVAFLDTVTIRYTIGAADALTAPEKLIRAAEAFLSTYLNSLEVYRERIDLPKRVLRVRLGDAHGWLGEELLDAGRDREARQHLLTSLRMSLWRPTHVKKLLEASLPRAVRSRLRKLLGKAER